MSLEFIFKAAKIINELDETQFKNYVDSENLFFNVYPALKEDYKKYEAKRKEPWHTTIREIRCWNDFDLRHMYSRIMRLSYEFKGTADYFKIMTSHGVYVFPDRTTRITALLKLSKELLREIYPAIEQSPNYKPTDFSADSPIIRGKIDWSKTLVNSIGRSHKYPISFVNIVPTQDFGTPENILLLITLFWIKNDTLRLLGHYMPDEFSKTDLLKLNEIWTSAENLLGRTVLKEIRENARYMAGIGQKHQKISELIEQTKERIRLGLVGQMAYSRLLTWIKEYLHFNMERSTKGLVDFKIERTENVDTMYEIWILLEIAHHMHSNLGMDCVAHIPDPESGFQGFEITIEGKRLILKYCGSYGGQLSEIKPDYTLERTKHDVPMVLDAKNWRFEKINAKHTMIYYLVNLSFKNTRKGILFFPNSTHLGEKTESPFNEEKFEIGTEKFSLITCVLTPFDDQDTKNKNKKVFEALGKIISSI